MHATSDFRHDRMQKSPARRSAGGLQVGIFPIKKPTEQQVSQNLLVWLERGDGVSSRCCHAATKREESEAAPVAWGCMQPRTS